jgi:hypothetical protein
VDNKIEGLKEQPSVHVMPHTEVGMPHEVGTASELYLQLLSRGMAPTCCSWS